VFDTRFSSILVAVSTRILNISIYLKKFPLFFNIIYIFWYFLSDYVTIWVVPVANSVPVMKNAFGTRNYYTTIG